MTPRPLRITVNDCVNDPGKSRPKKEKGVLMMTKYNRNCQICQCGTLNKKIRGWIECLWSKTVVFWNATLQVKIKYIASEALDFSRNTGADITWKLWFGLIVDMLAKGDNGKVDNCRQNIKDCKHGEDKTNKRNRHGGDRGNTEAIFCSSVSEGKKKARISK